MPNNPETRLKEVNKVIEYIADRDPEVRTYRLFRNVVMIFILYYTLTLIPMKEFLFGDDQVVPPFGLSKGLSYFIHALWYEPVSDYWWLFLVGIWVSVITILKNRATTFWMIVLYVLMMNVVNKVYMVNTSGHQLIYVFLFFFIFIEWGRNTKDLVLRNGLVNGGILACRIQLCLVYFVSALYKLIGTDWLSGKALGYVLNVDVFSLSWIEGVDPTDPILMSATYLTLAYQLLFPVLVWFRKIKLPFLLIGVITHLGIAFVMGLFEFGVIMVIGYLVFLPDRTAAGFSITGKRAG